MGEIFFDSLCTVLVLALGAAAYADHHIRTRKNGPLQ